MKIQIKLIPLDNEQSSVVIPLDFRNHFISLLKTLLHDSQTYSRFESKKPGYSPYVFSTHFNRIEEINTGKGQILIQAPVYMTISSGFFEVITEIINAAISIREKPAVLGLKIQKVEMLQMRRIRTGDAYFRICSHAAFRGIKDYLDGSNVQLLEESINQHMINKYTFFHNLPFTMQEEYKLSPVHILEDSVYKKGVCHHYGGLLTTLQGRIHLQGDPKSLQFLYDFGIGVRSGQGFGMIEVVR